MMTPLTREGISLHFSPSVVAEIDAVIDSNLNQPALVALFISRLLKGLQNLTNEELKVDTAWGMFSYEIEDIGVVCFEVFANTQTGRIAIAVNEIRWTFANSHFFSSFLNPL